MINKSSFLDRYNFNSCQNKEFVTKSFYYKEIQATKMNHQKPWDL